MNEKRAREILSKNGGNINSDNSLSSTWTYMYWNPGDEDITLDGEFSLEELEAIMWWMRNKHCTPTKRLVGEKGKKRNE